MLATLQHHPSLFLLLPLLLLSASSELHNWLRPWLCVGVVSQARTNRETQVELSKGLVESKHICPCLLIRGPEKVV